MATCANVKPLVVLASIIVSYINRQDVNDLNSPNQLKDGDHYDFIVIGAGSAGSVVANRLSETPRWRVLLVEAGGEEPLESSVPAFKDYAIGSRIDWNYTTQPQPFNCGGKGCSWPRGKTLGGTSVLNWMIYDRGNRHNYEDWKNQGNIGWGYDNVLPFFKRSENNGDIQYAADFTYHATGGYQSAKTFPYKEKNSMAIQKAFQQLGLQLVDINAAKQTGVMFFQASQQGGERRSTNRAFLEPIRDRPNLKIVTNCRAIKILIHQENNTVYGVEYAHENNRSVTGKIFVDKEIVVSSGTINSPQLLMLSGIGPKQTLEDVGIKVIQDLQVGQNLQDHVTSSAFSITLDDYATSNSAEEEISDDFDLYRLLRNGPFAGIGPTTTIGFANSSQVPKNLDYPDTLLGFLSYISPKGNETCTTNVVSPTEYYNSLIYWGINIRPKSRGYIILNSSNPFDKPLIYPNYFNDSRDLKVIEYGYSLGLKALQTDALKKAGFKVSTTKPPGCEGPDFGSDAYWDCLAQNYTQPLYHPAGTCKMGPKNDSSAVVDPRLRVYGIKGLRVADCSIMPEIISGTPSVVAMMIGERVAEFIREDWGASLITTTVPDLRGIQFSAALNQRLSDIKSEWRAALQK